MSAQPIIHVNCLITASVQRTQLLIILDSIAIIDGMVAMLVFSLLATEKLA